MLWSYVDSEVRNIIIRWRNCFNTEGSVFHTWCEHCKCFRFIHTYRRIRLGKEIISSIAFQSGTSADRFVHAFYISSSHEPQYKHKYYKNYFNTFKNNSKKVWAGIKSIISNKKTSHATINLQNNNEIITNQQTVANKFNDFL